MVNSNFIITNFYILFSVSLSKPFCEVFCAFRYRSIIDEFKAVRSHKSSLREVANRTETVSFYGNCFQLSACHNFVSIHTLSFKSINITIPILSTKYFSFSSFNIFKVTTHKIFFPRFFHLHDTKKCINYLIISCFSTILKFNRKFTKFF